MVAYTKGLQTVAHEPYPASHLFIMAQELMMVLTLWNGYVLRDHLHI